MSDLHAPPADAQVASRTDPATGVADGSEGRRARWRRRLGWVAGGTAAAVLLASGGIYGIDRLANAQITRIDPFGTKAGLVQPARTALHAQNILLVGSDSRAGLSHADEHRLHVGGEQVAAGHRADTMMLLHVGEGGGKVVVVSFPRDSYVTIPAHLASDGTHVPAHQAKINDAYAEGGPSLAIETVAQATGIHIDHYIEVNFLGFEKMVNALGGVTVCTPRRLDDTDSGLHMAAGTHHIDGQTALAYARARHIDSDFGRIGRQQKLLAALLREATSAGTLTNPFKLTALAKAALSSLSIDKTLSQGDMLQLARRIGGLGPSHVTFATIPIANDRYDPPGPVAYAVLWDQPRAQQLFTAIRDDKPVGPTPKASASASPSASGASGLPASAGVAAVVATTPPGQVRVEVLNGTGTAGAARRAASDLARVGFAVTGTGNAASRAAGGATVIRYDPSRTTSLKTLEVALPTATLQPVTGLGRTFQVVVGSGWTGAATVRLGAPTTTTTTSPAPDAAGSGAAVSIQTRSAADTTCTQ